MQWLFEHFETRLFEVGRTSITPVSVLIFLLILAVSIALGRLVRGGLVGFARRRKANEGVAYAVGRILQYLIVVTGLLIALGSIGIDLTALAAAGAILTVGIGLGLQGIVQNFFSGIVLLLERPVQKGDFVQVGDTVGTVQAVSLRSTRVVSRDGVSIIVPNSKLTGDTVINQSQPTSTYRVRVSVGVAYGSDTHLVRDTLLRIAQAHPAVLDTPPPRVFFLAFGESSLDFELAVWLDDPTPEPAVTSDLRFAIDRAFREADVTIPFPQRDLHLVSGFEKLRREGPGAVPEAPPARPARHPGKEPLVEDTSGEEKAVAEQVQREKAKPATEGERRIDQARETSREED